MDDRSLYLATYSPDLLQPIPRDQNRRILGLSADLPFRGEDIWNAYELTWLDSKGKPRVATAVFRVPATSPNIIESKSMKLYLNSLAMTRYADAETLSTVIADDLTNSAGAPVTVRLNSLSDATGFSDLPGICIDDHNVDCASSDVDPKLLACTRVRAVPGC